MKQYLDAVKEVLYKGMRKENRTGVDTISTFNINYEIDLRKGFPLLTTKEINWKNIVIENLWFLSGTNNPKFLHKHGVKFWNPWLDDKGLAPDSYGPKWRDFPVHGESWGAAPFNDGNMVGEDYNDQIEWVLNELKKNPMSRRLVVSAWDPNSAQYSRLPPCHLLWVLNVQNMRDLKNGSNHEPFQHLCCHLTQRSCDMALGVPYNIAGYGFLTHLFSRFSGIPVGILAHTLIDAHIYIKKEDGSMAEHDHVPGLVQQLIREPRDLPTLQISDKIKDLADVEDLITSDASTEEIMNLFKLENYNPHPPIKFKVAV